MHNRHFGFAYTLPKKGLSTATKLATKINKSDISCMIIIIHGIDLENGHFMSALTIIIAFVSKNKNLQVRELWNGIVAI